MKRELPEIIKQVGFDFDWDEKKVWQLDAPIEDMPIDQLSWHFEVPFWQSNPDGYYNLKPIDVINHPDIYREEYDRTMVADTSYPVDVMYWKQHWTILDGLHRLAKLSIEGKNIIKVRKISQNDIPKISTSAHD